MVIVVRIHFISVDPMLEFLPNLQISFSEIQMKKTKDKEISIKRLLHFSNIVRNCMVKFTTMEETPELIGH